MIVHGAHVSILPDARSCLRKCVHTHTHDFYFSLIACTHFCSSKLSPANISPEPFAAQVIKHDTLSNIGLLLSVAAQSGRRVGQAVNVADQDTAPNLSLPDPAAIADLVLQQMQENITPEVAF